MTGTVLVTGSSLGFGLAIARRFFLFLHARMPDAMWRSMIGEGMRRDPDRERRGDLSRRPNGG